MKGGFSTEERLEEMGRRLERAEQSNRAMKIWSSIAFAALIAFGSGPFASTVMAKAKAKAVTASEFDLESNGKIVATLGIFSGQPNLIFFDNAGKTVVGVGINGDLSLPTGHAAGIGVYDGNADIPGTGKLRATLGVTPSGPSSGVGVATYDGNGVQRSAAGSAVDGSLGFLDTIDPNGSITGIIDNDTAGNVDQGFFANDLNGKTRVFAGNSLDGTTFTTLETIDPNGSLAGIEDDDAGNGGQGFFANDLNGKNRLFAGTSLDGTSYDQISFSDTKGNFAGLLGTNTAFTPADMELFLADPSGTFFAGETTDGAGVGWASIDTNSVVRMFGTFDGSNENIEEFSPSDVLVGHLP